MTDTQRGIYKYAYMLAHTTQYHLLLIYCFLQIAAEVKQYQTSEYKFVILPQVRAMLQSSLRIWPEDQLSSVSYSIQPRSSALKSQQL